MPFEGLKKSFQQYQELSERTRKDIESFPAGKKFAALLDKLNQIAETPGTEVIFPMTGTTARAAAKTFRPFLERGITRRELVDAILTMRKIPKKVLNQLHDIHAFGEYPKSIGGFQGWFIPPSGWGVMPETKKMYPLATIIGHEGGGHGTTAYLLQKMKKDPANVYRAHQPQLEGIAEYLGEVLATSVGVPYAPKFPYGPIQAKTYNQLLARSSSNPYLRVYKYLQNLLKESL